MGFSIIKTAAAEKKDLRISMPVDLMAWVDAVAAESEVDAQEVIRQCVAFSKKSSERKKRVAK